MSIKCKNLSPLILYALAITSVLLIESFAYLLPAYGASDVRQSDSGLNDIITERGAFNLIEAAFGFVKDLISIITLTLSQFYFSYIHDALVSVITYLWPESWPQYNQMLATYQTIFYTVPLWFTGNFWPTSLFGSFPLWGIDLFILTEIFYIALRLITRKAAPFKGSAFSRFLKNMIYETWIFIKAPFFAAASVLFFLFKAEKEKRRILLFWFYSILLTAILVGIIAWFAQS